MQLTERHLAGIRRHEWTIYRLARTIGIHRSALQRAVRVREIPDRYAAALRVALGLWPDRDEPSPQVVVRWVVRHPPRSRLPLDPAAAASDIEVLIGSLGEPLRVEPVVSDRAASALTPVDSLEAAVQQARSAERRAPGVYRHIYLVQTDGRPPVIRLILITGDADRAAPNVRALVEEYCDSGRIVLPDSDSAWATLLLSAHPGKVRDVLRHYEHA